MFDIQKFAEENFDNVTTETAENDNLTTGENSESETSTIPEELEGISENIARQIMEKSAVQNKENEPVAEFDDVDDDGNYKGEKDLSKVKIPYSRFKQAIDKKNESETKMSEMEKQLAAYRQRFGDINSQNQQQTFQPQSNFQQNYQQFNQPVQNPSQQTQEENQQTVQKFFGEDDAKQIDEAIKNVAMQMTGFSEEDADAIDYLDDDDPKIGIWNKATELAKMAVYNQIISTQAAQAQEAQRRAILMNQTVSEFQNYTQQQSAAAEYEALRNFAATEFFKAQSPADQQIIYDADWRLQNNMATPNDYKTIKDFFTMAKYAYDAKNATAPAPKPVQKKSNPQFPRSGKVNGVPGSGGGVTAASLAEMVHNVPWSEIPQEYKDRILNATT